MFSKLFCYLWCIIAAVLFSSTVCAFDHYIDVRVSNSPPLNFIDKSGLWAGIDVELSRAVIEDAGFEPRFIAIEWSGALKRMKLGGLDLMTGLTKTEERSEYLQWIGPERKEITVLIVKKKDIDLPIWSLDDIPVITKEYGKKIGIIRGARYSDEFNRKIKKLEFSSNFEWVTKQELNIRKLEAGRIVGYFADKHVINYRIRNDPRFKGVASHSFILDESDVFFGVSKNVAPDTYTLLKKSYERLEEKGVLDEIRNRQW